MLVVEVQNDKGEWEEVSRYDPELKYTSTRHYPPKSLTGRQIAHEDCQIFVFGYERASRVREL